MNKLRIRFSKTGRAVYISHLDLMHTMQRAFSRAGFSLSYSEGFNPHPIISIALPLSVGTASLCEIMDFKLSGNVDLKLFPEILNSSLPEGITVMDAYEAEMKVSDLKWLEVKGKFEYDMGDLNEISGSLNSFFSNNCIIIDKKTKRGISEMNIAPAIENVSFKPAEDFIEIHAVVSAQEPTFNPDLFKEALRQLNPELEPDFAEFTRIEIYDGNMAVFR